MFVLWRKKHFIRNIAFFSVLLVAAVSAFLALKELKVGVTAITGEGQDVKITREWVDDVEQNIYYSSTEHNTVRFFVEVNGVKILAFCRNPDKAGPDRPDPDVPTSPTDYQIIPATKMSDTNQQNAIKILAYLGMVNDGYIAANSYSTAALNELFQGRTLTTAQKFGFLHAAMGYLEEGRTNFGEVVAADEAFVKSIGDKATAWVTSDADIFALARPYQLYGLDRTKYDTNTYQDIVWIEDATSSGDIKVKKCDAEAGCTTQGGSSLQGITFKVYNAGRKIYRGGTFYANGAEVASGTTDANGLLTFSNLPSGPYTVKETATNATYVLNNTTNSVTVTTGITETQFNNTVVKGSLTVTKKDANTNACSAQGSATLSGTQFTIYNKTGKTIYYGGSSYANNAAIDTKSINGSCQATFSGLPYGDYSVKETAVGSGYSSNSTEETFSITSNGQSVTKAYSNQVIRGSVKVKKCDAEAGCTTQGNSSL